MELQWWSCSSPFRKVSHLTLGLVPPPLSLRASAQRDTILLSLVSFLTVAGGCCGAGCSALVTAMSIGQPGRTTNRAAGTNRGDGARGLLHCSGPSTADQPARAPPLQTGIILEIDACCSTVLPSDHVCDAAGAPGRRGCSCDCPPCGLVQAVLRACQPSSCKSAHSQCRRQPCGPSGVQGGSPVCACAVEQCAAAQRVDGDTLPAMWPRPHSQGKVGLKAVTGPVLR